MPSINADENTKDRFDRLQPDDSVQTEFLADCLDAYELVDNSEIDMSEVLDRVEVSVASQAELAAYRGARDALEEHHE